MRASESVGPHVVISWRRRAHAGAKGSHCQRFVRVAISACAIALGSAPGVADAETRPCPRTVGPIASEPAGFVEPTSLLVSSEIVPLNVTVEASSPPKWLYFGVAATGVGAHARSAYIAIDAATSAEERTPDAPPAEAATAAGIEASAAAANVLLVAGGIFGVGAGAFELATRWAEAPEGRSHRVKSLIQDRAIGVAGRF